MLVVSAAKLEGQRSKDTSMRHTEWVGNTIKEIQTIKVGMTRKDLLRIFMAEGGLGSSRSSRTYLYRGCPYIKVDVGFQATQQLGERFKEFSDDTITSISKPYLANPTLD